MNAIHSLSMHRSKLALIMALYPCVLPARLAQPVSTVLSPQPSGKLAAPKAKSVKGITLVRTLEEALEAAYYLNVELTQSRYRLKQLVEDIAKVNSEWYPGINLDASHKRHTSRQEVKTYNPYEEGDFTKAEGRRQRHESALTFRTEQNIYAGGGTSARIRQANESFQEGYCLLIAQEQDTLMRTLEAYITVATAEARLEAAQSYARNQQKLLVQTQARHEVGEQKVVDVAVAKANLAGATVQVTNAQREVQASRAALERFIGAPLGPKLIMPTTYKPVAQDLNQLRALVLKNSPSLIAAIHAERAARHSASSVTSGFLPQIGLSASAGPRLDVSKSRRRGSDGLPVKEKNTHQMAEVGVSLTVPLIPNGRLQSDYRTAELKVKEARLQSERQRRSLLEQCDTTFAAFQAAQKNVGSIKIALDSNKLALAAAQEEYALGMISLLDINQIESQWLETYRQYLEATGELIKASYRVYQLAGRLTVSLLGLNVHLYDPLKYYERYHNAWFSLGFEEQRTDLFSAPSPQ